MTVFEMHDKRMRAFLADHQEVTGRPKPFEDHEVKMKVFRQNHLDISESAATTMGGVNKPLLTAAWTTLVPWESNIQFKFFPN